MYNDAYYVMKASRIKMVESPYDTFIRYYLYSICFLACKIMAVDRSLLSDGLWFVVAVVC